MEHQKNTKTPWYKEVHRWCQINLNEMDPVSCDVGFWRKYWRELGAQGIIVNAGGLVAFYPTGLEFQTRAAGLGDRDLFGEFAAAAKEDGLAVLARTDTNAIFKDVYEAHPDWVVVRPDGAPFRNGNNLYVTCINGPYHLEFLPKIIKEITERYGVNGFADNNWASATKMTGIICHCDNCKKGFMEAYGLELPEKPDMNDMTYKKWIKWNCDLRTHFWDYINQKTAELGGEDCLYLGMMPAEPIEAGFLSQDIKAIGERAKYLLFDHQSRYQGDGFETNSLSGNLVHEVAGWDKIIACCLPMYFGPGNFRRMRNAPLEASLWMLEGISGGYSPWAHHIGATLNDKRQLAIAPPIFKWHKQNEQYLYDREPVAAAGIVWSQDNVDFYVREKSQERHTFQWNGFKRAMTRSRIPFIPIHADNIAKYTDKLKVLILPNFAAMSDEQCRAVTDFVEAGGSLVFSGATATLDKWGDERKDYPLERITGIKRLYMTDELASDGGGGVFMSSRIHTYMRLPEQRHPLLRGFEETDLLPLGIGVHSLESNGMLKPVATYVPPFPYFPPDLSWMREPETDIPVVLAGEHPSGGRIVYFAGNIDGCYGQKLLSDHGDLLANAVRWAAADDLPFEADGPGYIDFKLYRQGNRLILHAVNLSGCNYSRAYAEEALPVGPVKVTFKTGGLSPSRVLLTVSGKEFKVEPRDSRVSIVIDSITDHELIVVE
ncbi:MAG: beta-galactosidase [Oscillospiraceae bacterium]|jgi:hypothetical protein|nr:beta-galactosidase [Oscillospiraceae bacterium]